MAELRDYQSGTTVELEQLVSGGARSILTVALIGYGKAVIGAVVVAWAVVARQRVLLGASRLVAQRWTSAGREVFRLVPRRPGADANDLLAEQQSRTPPPSDSEAA